MMKFLINLDNCMISFLFVLVTIDMYRMLQAVEKQSIESASSHDDKSIGQSPIPTNHQQRDIYVRTPN